MISLFYSYSHKDEEYRDQLENHLSVLKNENIIDEWHDRKISPGSNWEDDINRNLDNADVILLLISSNFLASDYCYDVETVTALDMHKNGQAVVIPVIIQPCLWNISKLGKKAKMQVLPNDGKPITTFDNKHEGWLQVAEGIHNVAQKILSEKRLTKKMLLNESENKKENLDELVIRFLEEFSRWYFSPLRIVKWGGRQNGFASLSRFRSNEVNDILKKLEKKGKLKKTVSQKGNPLYKLI